MGIGPRAPVRPPSPAVVQRVAHCIVSCTTPGPAAHRHGIHKKEVLAIVLTVRGAFSQCFIRPRISPTHWMLVNDVKFSLEKSCWINTPPGEGCVRPQGKPRPPSPVANATPPLTRPQRLDWGDPWRKGQEPLWITPVVSNSAAITAMKILTQAAVR